MRAVEKEDVVTAADLLAGLVGPHHEDGVALFEGEGVDPVAHVDPAAVDGEDDHAEALAEIELVDGLADDGGAGPDDALDDGALVGGNGFKSLAFLGGEAKPLDRAGLDKAAGPAGEDQPVAGLEFRLENVAHDGDPVADNLEQADPFRLLQVAAFESLSNERAVIADKGLGEVLLAFLITENGGEGFTDRQAVLGEEGEVQDPEAHERQADLAQFEHGKGRVAGGFDEAAGEDVGAGADEGADAPEDGGVA